MNIITQGFLGPLVVTQGYHSGSAPPPPSSTFISQPLFYTINETMNINANNVYKIISALIGQIYLIQNTGSSNIYIGGSNVSSSLGFEIAPGGSFPNSYIGLTGKLPGVAVDWYCTALLNSQVTVTISTQVKFIPFYSRSGNN